MSEDNRPRAKMDEFDALKLQAILQSAVAGIVTIDSRGIVHSANPAVETIFGYAPEEVVGHNVSMLMPESDRGHHDGYISRYLKTGEKRIVGIGREVLARRKDGSTVPVHLSVGQFERAGETYFTGVLIDISAQRKAEAQLSREHALFKSVFEAQADAIVIADSERKVVSINPAFTRVFGYQPSELVGRSAKPIYESDAEWVRHGRHGLDADIDDRLAAHVVQYRRKNGDVFPGSAVRTMICDRQGNAFGYLSVIRDISDDLRREAQLMQAQRMEAIGQLTGGIAHDFNNILTVILGNLELLEMRIEGDMEQDLAREAREATEMGSRLTDRLLTFGRRQKLETAVINLNEFILDMIDLLSRSIGEDIDISTSLAGELWMTKVDPGQIENAVLNLAINARDAMPSGGRITIETMNVSLAEGALPEGSALSAGDYVVLSVIDTGQGMEPEVQSRAFEPFFTTKPVGKGSGLGLSTIYGFAVQSGGHVTIDSKPGRGSAVNVYLPRSNAESKAETEVVNDETNAGFGRTRVLVVEDDERVRKMTTMRLAELGCVVEQAETGVQALEMLDAGLRVDAVLSDVVMPGGVSGLDLAAEVKRRFGGLKVVLTTGYSAELIGAEAPDAGVCAILRKPYRQDELASVLADLPGRTSVS